MGSLVVSISIAIYAVLVKAIPPPQCFANFRWDDCGRNPVAVMYYWKPGSRCEVGIWRGCMPNINMFKDEYECVSTCIFSVKAKAEDFHMHLIEPETTTFDFTTAVTNATDDTNSTGMVTGSGDTPKDGDAGGGSEDGGGGNADGGETGGDEKDKTEGDGEKKDAAEGGDKPDGGAEGDPKGGGADEGATEGGEPAAPGGGEAEPTPEPQ